LDEVGFRIFGVCWVHTFFLLNMELAFSFVIAFVLPMVLSSYWHVRCIWLIFEPENSTYHVPSSRAPQLMEMFHASSDGHVGWKF